MVRVHSGLPYHPSVYDISRYSLQSKTKVYVVVSAVTVIRAGVALRFTTVFTTVCSNPAPEIGQG